MATDNVTPIEQLPEDVQAADAKPTGQEADADPMVDGADRDPATHYRDALQSWIVSTQAMMGATQALGGETIAFWHSRTKAGLETTRRLAQCTSPQVLAEIQIDHARTAIQAYADQMAKLGEIIERLVRDGLAPASRSRPRVPAPTRTHLAA